MVPAITPEQMAARVGTEQLSGWVAVTQAMIDRFADATGDHQFIHVDPQRAAATPFGGTIAHGFLTLSLMPMLAAGVPDPVTVDGLRIEVNYGGNKVRFLAPVPSGSRVRGRFRLVEFVPRGPGRYQQTQEFVVEIEGQDKPALVAEWITLLVA